MKVYQNNSFLLQTQDNLLWYFFYSQEGNICYTIYKNRHWSTPIIIIRNTNSNFSVNINAKDIIYLFCQDLSGNVVLCVYKDNIWSSSVVLENTSNQIHNINFQMIMEDNSLNLIYTMPISYDKKSQLFYHFKENENWSSPQILDTISPLRQSPFNLQKINNRHNIIFYTQELETSSLGYREFSVPLKKWGKFNAIHKTKYKYTDQSFLTTENTLYVLYIVKNAFSCQLIFKKKSSEIWDTTILIFEGPKIELCTLFILENQLWLVWYSNSYLFTCVSNNMGKSFSKPQRYGKELSIIPYKAAFISNSSQQSKNIYLKEILISGNSEQENPKFLLIPEIYPDFYNYTENFNELNELKNKINSYEQLINNLNSEKNLLYETKKILEQQISKQSMEILSLQKQLESSHS